MNNLPSFRRQNRAATEDFGPIETSSHDRRFTWGYIAVGVGTAVAGVVSRPKAPKQAAVKELDPQASQREAIQGNLANADSIEQLVARSNKFTQGQASSLMEQAMPGYANVSSKFMKQADDLLTDPYSVPKDVGDNLTRIAAERGLNTGVRGEAGDFSLLRDFGINSLQNGNARISQAQSIIQTIGGLAPRVSPMSPISFYVTPGQQMQAEGGNNSAATSSNQAKNNADAAASNANSSMWGGIIANAAGIAGGALTTNANKPPSGTNTPAVEAPLHVDETWKF